MVDLLFSKQFVSIRIRLALIPPPLTCFAPNREPLLAPANPEPVHWLGLLTLHVVFRTG